MENNLFLDIPNFIPEYNKNKNYSYSKKEGNQNLKDLLRDTAEGYCMYCFSKIHIDRKNFGHLEHSIEKGSSKILKDCPINISITCPICNLSFKRMGENDRKLHKEELEKFKYKLDCNRFCNEMCENYKNLRKVFNNKKNGQIILQPFGVMGENENHYLLMQYDLLKQVFIPSTKFPYNKKEKNYINSHINRFNLNDDKYRTHEIIRVCKYVLSYNRIPDYDIFLNYIARLFIQKIEKMNFNDTYKICKIIYTQAYLLNKV